MHLVQILLPVFDNAGERLPAEDFIAVRDELTESFGGVTVYSRAPAEGLWKDADAAPKQDDVILFEVMVENLDRAFWTNYRKTLESRFRQQVIVVRTQEIEVL